MEAKHISKRFAHVFHKCPSISTALPAAHLQLFGVLTNVLFTRYAQQTMDILYTAQPSSQTQSDNDQAQQSVNKQNN